MGDELDAELGFSVGTRLVSPGVVVVDVGGAVDSASAPVLERELRVGLSSEPRVLVVDLSGVVFLASAGLGVLVLVHDLAESSAFRVVVGGPMVSRPLRVTGLDSVLEVFGSLGAALV